MLNYQQENFELKERIAELEDENKKLQARVIALEKQPPPPPTAEGLSALRFLESTNRNCKPPEIAKHLGWESGRAHHLLIQLRDSGFVYEVDTGFHIDEAGRAVLYSQPA